MAGEAGSAPSRMYQEQTNNLPEQATKAVWSEATTTNGGCTNRPTLSSFLDPTSKEPERYAIAGNSFSNLLVTAKKADDRFMPHYPQSQTKTRSPRVRVPNGESIRFNLGGHQVSAVLQKISMTGGLAEFPRSIGSATIAEAKVNTLSGPVSGLVEFLPPQVGSCTYPFRFIALSDQDYERLNATLQFMRKQGFGD